MISRFLDALAWLVILIVSASEDFVKSIPWRLVCKTDLISLGGTEMPSFDDSVLFCFFRLCCLIVYITSFFLYTSPFYLNRSSKNADFCCVVFPLFLGLAFNSSFGFTIMDGGYELSSTTSQALVRFLLYKWYKSIGMRSGDVDFICLCFCGVYSVDSTKDWGSWAKKNWLTLAFLLSRIRDSKGPVPINSSSESLPRD
jgi:hypothetical protein